MTIDELLVPLLAIDDDLAMEADIDVLGDSDRRRTWVERLAGLLGKAPPEGNVIPIVKHGSGSIVAVWRHAEAAALEECPVVWIDSQGSPCDVLSANLAEFVTLVPYSLGALYDCLRYATKALSNPSTAVPSVTCTNAAAWIGAGITPHPDPSSAVLAALRSHPRFSASI